MGFHFGTALMAQNYMDQPLRSITSLLQTEKSAGLNFYLSLIFQTEQCIFRLLFLPVTYRVRASILNKSCSPIITLQVCYNNCFQNIHGLKVTGIQKQINKTVLGWFQLTQIWIFANYFKFSHITWRAPNMKIVHFSKLHNFDIWTSSKFSLDSKLHFWASLRFQLELFFSNNLTTYGLKSFYLVNAL
jgi:hypothetical protein